MTERTYTLLNGAGWTPSSLGPNGANYALDLTSSIQSAFNQNVPIIGTGSKDFSIEMWAQFGGGNGSSSALFSDSTDDSVQAIQLSYRTNGFPFYGPGINLLVSPGDTGVFVGFSADVMHHVVATWDDNAREKRIYIDGALALVDTFANSRGQSNGPSRSSVGSVVGTYNICDEVRVYQKVLSAPDVLDHFNNQFLNDDNAAALRMYLPFSEGTGTQATTDTANEVIRNTVPPMVLNPTLLRPDVQFEGIAGNFWELNISPLIKPGTLVGHRTSA